MLQSTHNTLVIATFIIAVATFIILRWISAPYGRHNTWAKSGPSVPTRLGWFLMEAPSCFGFIGFFLLTGNKPTTASWILLCMWILHYGYRTLIYPLRLKVREGDRLPVLIMFMGITFNVSNSFLNATAINGVMGEYPSSWLTDPRFLIGVGVFFLGMFINHWADHVLRSLRKDGDTGYHIPRGGLYKYISSPNYFGEILEWTGWAIATWSLAGLSFAVYSVANLVPRALDNHQWYQDKFPEYPPERRAILPWIW